jgi:adenylate cyclase
MEFITTKLILANLVYSFLINSAIIILIQINRLLGKGNLRKLVMGKFHSPKEEVRAFMFMDLKGSTSIAEQLGHLKYSSFIQDCFYFLSVMDSYNVSIYQYVGDEVVLSWNLDKDDRLEDFLIAFNAYKGFLKDKKSYFQSKYGVQPVFKAGLHIGPVTVVEVGSTKREIAYHGDTINVASRIQEQCKIFNSSLLISEDVYEKVKELKDYRFKNVGEFVLRGRKNSIQLYDVLALETQD